MIKQKQKKLQQNKANYVQMNNARWSAPIHQTAPFTVSIVVICAIVALFLTDLGQDRNGAGREYEGRIDSKLTDQWESLEKQEERMGFRIREEGTNNDLENE